MPHADESFIETEASDRVDIVPKVLSPARQRSRVVSPKVLYVAEAEVGRAGQTVPNRAEARQKPPRKNVALNEINRPTVLCIAMIGNLNGLQQHDSLLSEQRRALGEVRREKSFTNGFDHLNRYHTVVLALQVSVILF